MGTAIGRRFQVAYSIDGGEEVTEEIKQTLGQDMEKDFSIAHPGYASPGKHSVQIRLVSVNGEADAYEGNNVANSTIRVMNTLPRAACRLRRRHGHLASLIASVASRASTT